MFVCTREFCNVWGRGTRRSTIFPLLSLVGLSGIIVYDSAGPQSQFLGISNRATRDEIVIPPFEDPWALFCSGLKSIPGSDDPVALKEKQQLLHGLIQMTGGNGRLIQCVLVFGFSSVDPIFGCRYCAQIVDQPLSLVARSVREIEESLSSVLRQGRRVGPEPLRLAFLSVLERFSLQYPFDTMRIGTTRQMLFYILHYAISHTAVCFALAQSATFRF